MFFGSTLLKHGRHFDYRNQPPNLSMRFCYLACHEAGLCCYQFIHIETLWRQLQLFYFHLLPIYWLSLVYGLNHTTDYLVDLHGPQFDKGWSQPYGTARTVDKFKDYVWSEVLTAGLRRVLYSGIWRRVVRWKSTNISEYRPIFRAEVQTKQGTSVKQAASRALIAACVLAFIRIHGVISRRFKSSIKESNMASLN
jgi:hypothetical protein